MPSKYYLIEGVPGRLLEDPRAAGHNPRRYLGMKRKADAAEIADQVNRYEPVRVVIPRFMRDGSPLVEAKHFRNGDLRLVGECVADSSEAATAQLLAAAKAIEPASAKAPKKDGN